MTTPPLSGYSIGPQIAQLEAQGFLVTGMTVERNAIYCLIYSEVSKTPPNPQPELLPADSPGRSQPH